MIEQALEQVVPELWVIGLLRGELAGNVEALLRSIQCIALQIGRKIGLGKTSPHLGPAELQSPVVRGRGLQLVDRSLDRLEDFANGLNAHPLDVPQASGDVDDQTIDRGPGRVEI